MSAPIQIRIIASGSTGNTSIVKFGNTRLLVDAGVPYKRIAAALDAFGGPEGLDGVVITHEHHDHVRGLDQLFRARPDLPVFASAGTFKAMSFEDRDTHVLKPLVPQSFGDVDITGFRVAHDATEVLGLRFEGFAHTLCYATDLGAWSDQTVAALQGANTLVLESNHDPDLLRRGPYPVFLKRRISGSRGHLSNEQARALLERVAHPGLTRVVLAHLSETNNTPELARRTAEEFLHGSAVSLHVASPDTPSPIWTPTAGVSRRAAVTQLSLFG
ncbi:MAG: MBL fold metallo-hydrolase [bacterium]